MSFIIFFSIVIGVYTLANIYIFQKGLFALSAFPAIKTYFTILFWFLVLTYPAGRIIERLHLSHFSDFLIWTGSFWLAALLYFFMVSLLIDIVRLTNNFWPYLPGWVAGNGFRIGLFSTVVGGVLIMLIGGFVNSKIPVVKSIDLHIHKQAGDRQSLHAVLISDIHLGTIIGNGHLERIIAEINRVDPEIVFIAGDLVDEDLLPVLRQDIGHTLKKLQPPLGVYAVTGNHEYIGGVKDAVGYLEEYGINFIRDTVLKVDDSFYLIGREDREKPRFTGNKRRPLEELISMTDDQYPVILIDHQPFNLQKTAGAGVDMQLSGHTHHGQLWPLNYITSAIYSVSRGYEKISGMHVYVTSGVGTWGPPVRIGSRPEIISMRICFNDCSEK